MGKRVLLIGGNYFPEPTGIGKYNGEMIDWLSNNGYSCTVVTTFPYYPYWKVQPPYDKAHFFYKTEARKISPTAREIKVIRCPHYVPQNPTGVKRILADLSFFLTAYFAIFALFFTRRHDYVMAVAPPFKIGLLAVLYKYVKRAKFLYHIQDLQIDAARDLQMLKSESLINVLFAVEKFILKHANHISTISVGMQRKVTAKCNREVLIYPNWVDTNLFYPKYNVEQLKKEFGFEADEKIVLYSGAIGEKQGLEAILEAANCLKNEGKIKFVICGSGPYKEKLQNMKAALQLSNVIFYPLQPFNKFNDFLNIADVHLVLQKANASDLVMPSKLTTILSVGGLAVVTAVQGTTLHEVITTSEIGFVIQPEDQEALNNCLKTVLSEDNYQQRSNARTYAETNLSIKEIMTTYSTAVLDNKISAHVSNLSQAYT